MWLSFFSQSFVGLISLLSYLIEGKMSGYIRTFNTECLSDILRKSKKNSLKKKEKYGPEIDEPYIALPSKVVWKG